MSEYETWSWRKFETVNPSMFYIKKRKLDHFSTVT